MSKFCKFDTIDQPRPAPTLFRRATRALTAFLDVLESIVERRRARAALRAFDDRMLRDIGICRNEVEHLLRDGKRWWERD